MHFDEGDYEADLFPNPDYQIHSGSLFWATSKPRVHWTDKGIDSTAPTELTGSDLAAVRAAAQVSTLACSSALAAVYPTWWPQYAADFAGLAREVYRLLPG